MNQLVKNLNTVNLTMTSREIAELVDSRHDSVKRTIETLAEKGIIEFPSLMEISTATKPVSIYVFSGEQGKRDSYAVVAKLSPGHIGGVIDAWGRTQDTLNDLLQAFESFDVPPEFGSTYVYAIQEAETGRIKLGISSDPVARLAQLQTGNSQRLRLVAYRKANNGFNDERTLHRAAGSHHVRGEWFDGKALGVMQ